jgi:hypothetical protein
LTNSGRFVCFLIDDAIHPKMSSISQHCLNSVNQNLPILFDACTVSHIPRQNNCDLDNNFISFCFITLSNRIMYKTNPPSPISTYLISIILFLVLHFCHSLTITKTSHHCQILFYRMMFMFIQLQVLLLKIIFNKQQQYLH